MTRKRKVGPGGGDFALNPNRFGGGGGLSIGSGKVNPKPKAKPKAKPYKVTPKSFKKKPMTQAQARHATRPNQKKYETNLEIGGKKYKLKDSDGGTAARRKGINPLDRSDASRQRLLPDRVKKKAGKTKVLKQKTSNFHWSEGYK